MGYSSGSRGAARRPETILIRIIGTGETSKIHQEDATLQSIRSILSTKEKGWTGIIWQGKPEKPAIAANVLLPSTKR